MKWLHTLRDHILPHRGNNHSPKIFAAEVVGELLLIVMLFQVAFVAHVAMVKNSNFLASVLPAVLITMTNVDRVEAGVSELADDSLLARAAQAKADDMAARGYFAHRDPDGRDPWYWFDKVGYAYGYAGENLAIDFSESAEVEEAWMNSPAHKANMMKGKFTKVGIGVAKGMYEGKETIFVVQFFATPPSAALAVVAQSKPVVPALEPVVPPERVVPEPEVLPAAEPIIAVRDSAPQVLGEAFEPIASESETTIILDTEQVTIEPSVGGEPVRQRPLSHMQERFIELASSPSQWYMPLLVAMFVLLAGVFVLSFVVHISKREVEGMAMAVVVLVFLAGLVHLNFGGSTSAQVPSDGQYASVGVVFR